MERVKSSDVLDATHEAKRVFTAKVQGYFRRLGPNPWDDYQFVRTGSAGLGSLADGDPTPADAQEVLPGVPLQLEPNGVDVRLRSSGRVVRLRWLPGAADEAALGSEAGPKQLRSYFVDHYLATLGTEPVLGAAAVMVRKLG